jgi:hypothetical protein
MTTELARTTPARALATGGGGFALPAVIADQGEKAAERFFTFFTDTIPNANTWAAYYRNVMRFFAWTHAKGLSLPAIKSYHVSGYTWPSWRTNTPPRPSSSTWRPYACCSTG